MSETGFGGMESLSGEKEIAERHIFEGTSNSVEVEEDLLEIREEKFGKQLANLERKNSELGLAPLSEETKRMIRENTIGGDESNEKKSSENISRERELKRELKENDLIIPEGKDIEKAEELLKKNGVPCMTERYVKGVDVGESGRVPGEFVLVINDPQNPKKPAPFDFVKKVFQFLQENEIVVRYAKNPEKAGAEMENENQE
ncbi:MAG: hypothetical protein ACD_11C00021G0012 [uncultured bacterium]|nr:MAG: hypothetical protein ACD_11C00021G0012 [uncultured bacterium]HBR71812.1 hypothetical protein [Candidatus Moranbacteria bacterium]